MNLSGKGKGGDGRMDLEYELIAQVRRWNSMRNYKGGGTREQSDKGRHPRSRKEKILRSDPSEAGKIWFFSALGGSER